VSRVDVERQPITLDGDLVRRRRQELGSLSRRELLERYAKLPGRKRRPTLLDSRLIVDIIIWVEADRRIGRPRARS
jgi:hypothetical protein